MRTEEQEEKRKQILATVSGVLDNPAKATLDRAESLSPRERAVGYLFCFVFSKVKIIFMIGDSNIQLNYFEKIFSFGYG